jgi:hypothetical protein
MQTFNFPYKHYMYTAKIFITQPPYEKYNFIVFLKGLNGSMFHRNIANN